MTNLILDVPLDCAGQNRGENQMCFFFFKIKSMASQEGKINEKFTVN